MSNTPGIADVVSVAGYSLLSGTNSPNMGMVSIIFGPWEARRDPALSQEAILAALRRQFGAIREGFTTDGHPHVGSLLVDMASCMALGATPQSSGRG